MNGKHLAACGLILFFILWIMIGTAFAQTGKPNILVIWGDDIGTTNISFNNRSLMGYRTPNINRIAQEGASFTDITVSIPAPPDEQRFWAGTILCAPA